MTPKPLSKEPEWPPNQTELTGIRELFGGPFPKDREAFLKNAVQTIELLLAAEQYWREAVRALDLDNTRRAFNTEQCRWCKARLYEAAHIYVNPSEGHAESCPWRIANE